MTEVDRKLKRDLSYESSVKPKKVRRASPVKVSTISKKSPTRMNLDVIDNSQKDIDLSCRNSTKGQIFASYMRSPYKLMDMKNKAR